MSFAVGRKVGVRRIAFAALTGVSLVACTSALHAQAPTAPQAAGAASVSVPSGSLESGILSLGRQLNLRLLYPSALTRGKRTAGVSGTLAPGAAVSALLAGTGLSHRFAGANVVQIFDPAAPAATDVLPAGAISLETIEVQGEGGVRALQNDGLAKDGYRASTLSSVGPLGPMALKDTPFSVNVVPRELLQNIQAQSPDDVLKISPSTRTVVPQSTGWTPMITIRGFQTYDVAEDGLRRSSSFATVLEDKERVEILNGLSGFLYGAGAPAGIVNYVYKRPTFERLTSITTGTYGGGQAYVHGDFGGRLDEAGRIGYRLNVVKEYGDTSIDDQKINRGLVSGALDWQATDALKFELNASYNRYRFESPTAYWFYTTGVSRKPVPDTSKNWSQPWIRDQFEKGRIAGRMTYDVTDWLKFRGAYSYEDYRRPVQDHTQNSVPSAGVYRQIAIHSGPTRQSFEAAQALFDADFATGPLTHKLTFGYYMQNTKSWSTTYSPNSGWLGPFSLATPVRLPIPTFAVNRTDPYYAGFTRNHNFVVGDQIDLGKHWSALVGVNYSRIENQSFNAVGARSQPDYDEGRLSPSASLIYKPLDWLSIYGTYVEGLEQGGVAPATAVNFGAVMRPMVSRQQEVGVKAQLGGVLLTGALFDIEKAYEFTNAGNLYVQDGTQRHRGIELTATGKMTEALTVVGGLTFLDAKIEGGTNNGKDPMNVARVLAKLYAEYEIPGAPGLVLTGGVYHTGSQWANAVNVDKLPAYTTLDLGIRYTTEIAGKPLTLRVNVNNVTDKNYFQNSYYLGAPRTVAFSAQMKF